MHPRASAALLSRVIFAIARHGSSGPTHGSGAAGAVGAAAGVGGSRRTVPADKPILADYLVVGEGRHRPREPPAEDGAATAATEFTGAAHRRLGTRIPPGSGAADGGTDVSGEPRERRLVAAALRPREALQQVPAVEQQVRSRLDAGGLRQRPQRLPPLFAAGKASPVARGLPKEQEATWRAGSSGNALGSGIAPKAPVRARSSNAGALPKSLRQTICRAIFADFSREVDLAHGAGRGGPAGAGVLTRWEREVAMRLCAEAGIPSLVRHLALAELQLERGLKRQSLARARAVAAAVGPSPSFEVGELRAERQHLLQEWRYAREAAKGEQAVVRLYLDGQLSWSRIRPQWQPRQPPATGEAPAASDAEPL